jgi:hypothetical protein
MGHYAEDFHSVSEAPKTAGARRKGGIGGRPAIFLAPAFEGDAPGFFGSRRKPDFVDLRLNDNPSP